MTINDELNVLDTIVDTNVTNDELMDDIREIAELKINSTHKKITPVTVANIYGGKKNNRIKSEGLRVLFDTGCCTSLAKDNYSNSRKRNKMSTYATGSGVLTTKYESEIHFTLPEFSDKKIIKWKFNVTDSEELGYDMIIGRDILTELGINFSFDTKTVEWEGISIPMSELKY